MDIHEVLISREELADAAALKFLKERLLARGLSESLAGTSAITRRGGRLLGGCPDDRDYDYYFGTGDEVFLMNERRILTKAVDGWVLTQELSSERKQR